MAVWLEEKEERMSSGGVGLASLLDARVRGRHENEAAREWARVELAQLAACLPEWIEKARKEDEKESKSNDNNSNSSSR